MNSLRSSRGKLVNNNKSGGRLVISKDMGKLDICRIYILVGERDTVAPFPRRKASNRIGFSLKSHTALNSHYLRSEKHWTHWNNIAVLQALQLRCLIINRHVP